MSLAVAPVHQAYGNGYGAHQYCVEDEPVDRRRHYQERYGELAGGLKDTDVGKGRHALVGDDGGVVRHAYEVDDKRNNRELQHPVGSRKPVSRYRHLRVKEPYACRFNQYDDNQRQYQLYRYGGGECLLQARTVAPAKLERYEPAYGSRQRAGNDAEHSNDAADDIVNAEVLYAEGVQHHAAGVQRHHHQQQHAKIQQQRILSDTFIIL